MKGSLFGTVTLMRGINYDVQQNPQSATHPPDCRFTDGEAFLFFTLPPNLCHHYKLIKAGERVSSVNQELGSTEKRSSQESFTFTTTVCVSWGDLSHKVLRSWKSENAFRKWTLHYTAITVLASSDAIVDSKRALYFRSRFPQQPFYIFIHFVEGSDLNFQTKFKGFRYLVWRDTFPPHEEKDHLHWRLWCAEERKLSLKISKELTMHFLPRLCFAPCASSSTLDPPELMGE